MAGLVMLAADLEVVHQVPAVLGGAEQMHLGAGRAGGSAAGLAVDGHCPQPSAGQRFACYAVRRARWPRALSGGQAARAAAALAWSEQGADQGSWVKTGPAPPASSSHAAPWTGRRAGPTGAQPGQVRPDAAAAPAPASDTTPAPPPDTSRLLDHPVTCRQKVLLELEV